ncbi:hypothetical protein LCGC14_2753040 [marine sediment metagenome]|uniref:Uncharacterized protein n=1 Tax=marine sediment metagenome TaxID=412755 RepID=A0A0F8Z149_9ZZZZ
MKLWELGILGLNRNGVQSWLVIACRLVSGQDCQITMVDSKALLQMNI